VYLTFILAALAVLSLALTLWQWLAARRFRLHELTADKTFAPAVTVLKPLKGCEATTRDCLRSWLAQDYPGAIQVLFGVDSADDPVCNVVRQLIAEHPADRARLVVCAEALGANAKVSKLAQLDRLSEHGVIVVSDADVRVPPDFLANAVSALRDPAVGLVHCFYRLANPATPAMQWEAVAINADFWSQVLQAQSLKPIDFALGAVMITRRTELAASGGFDALVDYLADDYQLGNRIARRGKRIVVCPVVVECWSPPMTWGEVWRHQLRWARTIRVCQPLPYFFSILSNATLWPLLWFVVRPQFVTLGVFAACLLVRIATARFHQRRLGRSAGSIAAWWFVPLKDMLQLPLWALAFLGRHVEWRGQRYRVQPGGKLEPCNF
jgi:ceramide glucosyltransferase